MKFHSTRIYDGGTAINLYIVAEIPSVRVEAGVGGGSAVGGVGGGGGQVWMRGALSSLARGLRWLEAVCRCAGMCCHRCVVLVVCQI